MCIFIYCYFVVPNPALLVATWCLALTHIKPQGLLVWVRMNLLLVLAFSPQLRWLMVDFQTKDQDLSTKRHTMAAHCS